MFELVRWSMSISTILVAVFGYTDQLRLILTNKSTEGLSFLMILLGLWVWLSYALYGFLKKDYKMLWSNVVGIVIIGAIFVSFFVY